MMRCLIWLIALLLPAASVADTPPPTFPGYVIEQHGDWRWGSREGKHPPGDKLARVIDDSLRKLRAKLATVERHGLLMIYTAQRAEFHRAMKRMGAREPSPRTLAVAFPDRGVMIIDGENLRAQPLASTTETIAHELAHLLLPGSPPKVPRWYHEGVAQWLSGARVDADIMNEIGNYARQDELATLDELNDSFPGHDRLTGVSYRQSLLFVAFVSERFGDDVHARILDGLEAGSDMKQAFRAATGSELGVVEKLWRDEIAEHPSWFFWLIRRLGVFEILAVILIFGYIAERSRRRRALRRMALEEAAYYGEDP